MPSEATVSKIRDQRDKALARASSASRRVANARDEAKMAKKAKNKALREQAKEFSANFLLASGSFLVGGAVGGQLTRVTATWAKWLRYGSLAIGLIGFMMSEKPWHFVLSSFFLGIGGVVVSDMSRRRDWIPGDWDWETATPPMPNRIVVVEGE